MSNTLYWRGQLDNIQNSQPKSSSSYYNNDFATKVREAQENIDNLVSEKDKSWSDYNQKIEEYNAFKGTTKTYSDIYKSSANEFGVESKKDFYDKSKQALAMTESTLSALPSSINAASNRVMTQNQREARYNVLADRINKTMTYQSQEAETYRQAWKNAREEQANKAAMEVTGQNNQLNSYGGAWTEAMNAYNNAVAKVSSAKLEKSSWEKQYQQWQRQQYNNAVLIWSNQLNSVLTRYVESLNNEAAELLSNSKKRVADISAYADQVGKEVSATSALYYGSKKKYSGGALGTNGGGGW